MKSKLKNRLIFSESIHRPDAVETLLNIQNFTVGLYEVEGMDTWSAQEEAKRLIFSKYFDGLTGKTVAQWIAHGGLEKKAYDVIKDLISDAVKANQKKEEQKKSMLKNFTQ